MVRVSIALGWLVWLATIFASGAINFLAGYQFGRETFESEVFGILGVAADTWKAVGPIFILMLWRHGRKLLSVAAAAIWTACFVFAVTSALGLAAQNRSALTGKREAVHGSYQMLAEQLEELQRARERLGIVPSVSEVEAAISSILANPIGSRGTVGSLSDDCAKDDWRTRNLCGKVVKERVRLAEATEASRLDHEIADVRREVALVRERGGTLETDPQADLIERLSLGYIAREDVGLGIVVLMAVMIELISAFAPVILLEAATMTPRKPKRVAGRRGESRPGTVSRGGDKINVTFDDVYEYLAECIEADGSASVAFHLVFEDYRIWCSRRKVVGADKKAFLGALKQIIERDMAGKVSWDASMFFGFRLKEEDGTVSIRRTA